MFRHRNIKVPKLTYATIDAIKIKDNKEIILTKPYLYNMIPNTLYKHNQ